MPFVPAPTEPAKPACEKCDDLGWFSPNVPFGHPLFGKFQRCDCQAQSDAQRLAQRLNAISGMDDRERSITLEAIVLNDLRLGTRQMVDHARAFIANPIGFLTFHGTSGNAKTYALKAIVNESLARGHGATYTRLTTLLYYIRSAYERTEDGQVRVKSPSDYQRLQELSTVQILVIDECDPLKVKQSEWVNQIETDLIDVRYEAGESGRCGTVLAMNGNPADFPPWIESRLRQWPIIENNDPDLRPLLKRAQ
jgi:DNA replication protein DnaC